MRNRIDLTNCTRVATAFTLWAAMISRACTMDRSAWALGFIAAVVAGYVPVTCAAQSAPASTPRPVPPELLARPEASTGQRRQIAAKTWGEFGQNTSGRATGEAMDRSPRDAASPCLRELDTVARTFTPDQATDRPF